MNKHLKTEGPMKLETIAIHSATMSTDNEGRGCAVYQTSRFLDSADHAACTSILRLRVSHTRIQKPEPTAVWSGRVAALEGGLEPCASAAAGSGELCRAERDRVGMHIVLFRNYTARHTLFFARHPAGRELLSGFADRTGPDMQSS